MVTRRSKITEISASIYDIPGVDKEKGALVEKLCGGSRVVDLLLYAPYNYVDRRNTDLEKVSVGEVVTFQAVVKKLIPPFSRRGKGRRLPYKVLVVSEIWEIWLVFFNYSDVYLENVFKVGYLCVVSGKLEKQRGVLQITHPDHFSSNVNRWSDICILEPVYSVTKGLHSRFIHKLIKTALKTLQEPQEWIRPQLLEDNSWHTWKESLYKIHNPNSLDEVSISRSRLSYDELLGYHATMYFASKRNKNIGVPLDVKGRYRKLVAERLEFSLTEGQEAAIEEITQAQMSRKQMAKLLQGDVGSGKTVVALFAMLNAVEGKGQVAFMVPTEILAEQHCAWISEILTGLEVCVAILTGNTKNKSAIKNGLMNGDIHIVIGTHTLFQESVKFHNLRLVVVDEQQRFGVIQRMRLIEKGESADILFITATPIPRTLEQILYGNMDRVTLSDKPQCRLPVRTSMVHVDKIEEVCIRLGNMIAKGNRAYWICPYIVETEKQDVGAVESRFLFLREIFGGVVGMVHGALPQSANDEIMAKFHNGGIKLLVATSIIEVGINVPDATIIVIENPERFGLSQLHQLRGRVGRSDKQSYCILLHGAIGKTSWSKLNTIRSSQDGFYIAEQDLILRGGGDMFGYRQSGVLSFRFADPLDFSNMSKAYSEVSSMVKTEEGKQMASELVRIYGPQLSDMNY